MEFEKLKKGDKINNVEFGFNIHSAKVIENFPEKKKIYLKINLGLWGLMSINVIKKYEDYNFDLIR